ncbi:MAG: hypothetical protein ACK4NA_02165 [Alphaproteobacteria bacterium]
MSTAMTASPSAHSSMLEKVLEHLLVGEILRYLWLRGHRDIEVLRGEVDNAGYDIALEVGGILRHVQLKACFRGATTNEVGINIALARKPSGCVIWLHYDPQSLALTPYLWFGGAPGEPLPSLGERVGRHSKANSEGVKAPRANVRLLSRKRFESLATIDELVARLFGAINLPSLP